MFQPTPDNLILSKSLESLNKDSRLKRLFSSNDADICGFYLWLLEIKIGNTDREYRLLYSWVIPRSSEIMNQWKYFKSRSEWKVSPYEFRIYRLNFYHTGTTILSITKLLCEGMTLGEACEKIDVSQPEEKFKKFCLTIPVQKISQYFIVRPVFFLETSFSVLSIIEQLKPLTSPIDGVSTFVGSLFRLDKLQLFCKFNSNEQLPEVDELAKICLSHLKEETGLDFCNADSQRLGNLEWLCFPSANQEEQSQVKIIPSFTSNQVEVEILPDILPTGMRVLIRCRAKNGGIIILDECQVNQISEQASTSVLFQAQEQINSVIITIWTQKLDSTIWEIWYEHSTPIMRKINLNIGVCTSEINLPSNWLQEFARSRIQERVEKIQKFNQVSYEFLEIHGRNINSLVLASQQIRSFSQKLFPQKSYGQFFQKGWAKDTPIPGRLDFFEWLQKLTNDANTSAILIIDPFFDVPGIEELIIRVSAVQAKYIVITNTQVKSDDDLLQTGNNQFQTVDKTQEPQRANRLRAACYRSQILLKNLKFQLLDIRGIQGRKNQIFHDRYILVFNQHNNVKLGYHLSNSIQGATRSYPLLITPIPEDVIPLVEDYIADLLEPVNNEPRQIIELYSSIRENNISTQSNHPTGLDSIPNANLFFAALLQDVNLVFLNQIDLGKHLQNQGLYDLTTCNFDNSETNIYQIKTFLERFTQTLLTADTDFFAKLWSGLGAWLDHSSIGEEYLAVINNIGGEALVEKLHIFLSQVPDHLNVLTNSYDATIQEDALQLQQFIHENFAKAVQDAHKLLMRIDSRLWKPCLQDLGTRYITKALITLEPALLVNVITNWQILTHSSSSLEHSHLMSVIYTLSFTFQEMLLQLIIIRHSRKEDNVLIEQLLKSSVASLRAIAAYSLCPLYNTNNDVKESYLNNSFELLANLTEIEIIYTLSEWIYHLRIRANVTKGETEVLRNLRLTIFKRMRQVFPNNLPLDDLKKISCRLSGPYQQDWTKSTNEDLFRLLVNDGKISINQVAQLWLSILEQILCHLIEPNKEQHYILSPDFSANSELIEVFAWAIANASLGFRDHSSKILNKFESRAQRIISRPFIRSQNLEAWNKANTCLSCLQTIYRELQINK